MSNLKIIYFDNAASSPLDKNVLKTMLPYFSKIYGNPNSIHQIGQLNFKALNLSRKNISEKLNCASDEIIFTGSATEANNLFIQGAIKQFKVFQKNLKINFIPEVITSQIEHESVLNVFKDLEKQNIKVIYLPVDKNGLIKINKLKEALNDKTILISIMTANNEIGTIQPILKISEIIKEFKKERISPQKDTYPLFHTDAVQAYQFSHFDLEKLNLHGLTLSAHKIYGPKGIGLIYLKKIKHFIFDKIEIINFQPIQPIILGGGQEFNFRAGTQNIPYIVGFSKAIELVEKERKNNYLKILKLRNFFVKELKKINKEIKINGFETIKNNEALPNILNIYLPKYTNHEMLIKLDLNGICVSSGSACLSKITQESYVLKALNLPLKRIRQSLRFSFSKFNNIKEIKYTLKVLKKILN